MVEYQEAWNVKGIYAAVVLRVFSYLFLLFGIRKTQYTLV